MSEFIIPGETTTPTIVDLIDPNYDLTGRSLCLDITKQKRFVCGHFNVNIHSPIAVVGFNSQQAPIKSALATGVLKDITDRHKTGVDTDGANQSPVSLEDTGRKVYVTLDKNGSMSVIAPRDTAHQEALESILANQGVVLPDNSAVVGHHIDAELDRVKPGHTSEPMEAFNSRFRRS